MSFLTEYIASRQVKKIAQRPRQKQFVKLQEAKNVGLVFDAGDQENFELIKKFIQQIKEYCKGIHTVGYIDAKVMPSLAYIKTDIDLFNRSELKKLYQPQSPYIKTFIEAERDILIDANIGDKLPLRYIAAASKAKCKVGVHTAGNEHLHDVLLNVGTNNGLEFFLQQTLKYLT